MTEDDEFRCYFCHRRVPPPPPRVRNADDQYLCPVACAFAFCARFKKARWEP